MNIRPLIILVLIGSFLAFSGCKATGKKKLTDWSIPTVKLSPHSKDEKVTPPAEKASAESTANLARDRLKGHNPTAAIRANDDDPTLRPDPQEVAKLNEFEGRKTPDWAVGALPSAPEASAPIPSERIAQNVSEQTLAAESSNPGLPAPSNPNLLEDGLPDSVDSLPGTVPQTASLPSNQTVSPGQAGDVMTELPGTLDGNTVQASATLPAQGVDPNAAQPIPTVPAQTLPQTLPETLPQAQTLPETLPETLPQAQTLPQTLPQAQAQPQTPQQNQGQAPVLFMPGNINPQYPNAPSASQGIQ